MNSQRREFLKLVARRSADIATAAAGSTAAYTQHLSTEFRELSHSLKSELHQKTTELGKQIRHVGNRVEALDLRIGYQQFQLHLIFLLLLISYMIDGGITAAMVLG